jgi:bifunctional non-homologous end joining protein LigD
LPGLPDDTVIDGEVVATDETGKPSFNLLQNFGSSKPSLVYYIFDMLILAGRDVMNEMLSVRCGLLRRRDPAETRPSHPRISPLDATLPDLITAVKAQGLEGRVPNAGTAAMSQASAPAWAKMRVKPDSGICHQRIHNRRPNLRCPGFRLL